MSHGKHLNCNLLCDEQLPSPIVRHTMHSMQCIDSWMKRGFPGDDCWGLELWLMHVNETVDRRWNDSCQLSVSNHVVLAVDYRADIPTTQPPTTRFIPPTTPPGPVTTPVAAESSSSNSNIIIGVSAPICLIIVGIAVFMWVRFNGQSKKKMVTLRRRATVLHDSIARNLYQQNGGVGGLRADDDLESGQPAIADHWEVKPSRVALLGELGEGAFGKVWKGELRPESDTQSDNSNKSNWVQAVAVKKLKGQSASKCPLQPLLVHAGLLIKRSAWCSMHTCDWNLLRHRATKSAQQRPAFVCTLIAMPPFLLCCVDGCGNSEISLFKAEIALMKDVGHHPNVVKMLACCTAPGNLMLITEFVPFDNLQNFLHLAKDRKRQVSLAKSTLFPQNWLHVRLCLHPEGQDLRLSPFCMKVPY